MVSIAASAIIIDNRNLIMTSCSCL